MKISIDGTVYAGSAREIVTKLRLDSSFIGAKTDDEFITEITSRLPSLAQTLVSSSSLLRAEEFIGALVVAKMAERIGM